MWVTGLLSAFCLGEHDNKPLQRTPITPYERTANTVKEIFGCCKMLLLSSLCGTLLFLFPTLPSPFLSAQGWKVCTTLSSFHFTFQVLFLLNIDAHLCSSSTHPPYPKQLSYKSVTPVIGVLRGIGTMPKNREGPFPCPKEAQWLQWGESGQRPTKACIIFIFLTQRFLM